MLNCLFGIPKVLVKWQMPQITSIDLATMVTSPVRMKELWLVRRHGVETYEPIHNIRGLKRRNLELNECTFLAT